MQDVNKLVEVGQLASFIVEEDDSYGDGYQVARWVNSWKDHHLETALAPIAATGNSESIDYGRGALYGVLCSLYFLGLKSHEALYHSYKYFPKNFELDCVDPKWIHERADWEYLKLNDSHVIPYGDLAEDLAVDVLEQVHQNLVEAYLWEMALMSVYAREARRPRCFFYRFRSAGSQQIAEFEVRDIMKEHVPNSVNWHGQNTSQWVYAGAVVVQKWNGDDYRVTRHH
jgi:hypothetical protein